MRYPEQDWATFSVVVVAVDHEQLSEVNLVKTCAVEFVRDQNHNFLGAVVCELHIFIIKIQQGMGQVCALLLWFPKQVNSVKDERLSVGAFLCQL
jgi:hypothetical protein